MKISIYQIIDSRTYFSFVKIVFFSLDDSLKASLILILRSLYLKVIFPGIDLVLVVFFFAKLGTDYFDCRKHGQF